MRTLVFVLSCILSSTALSQVEQFSNRWNSKAKHKTSKVPLVVVVENASGKMHSGDYTLTVSR
jgi:hypothetical protein